MTTADPIRIALLVTGQLSQPIAHRTGQYPDVFKKWLETAAEQIGCHIEMNAYDVKNEGVYPSDEDLRSYDAIMMTGSAASAYDDIPWIKTLIAFVQDSMKKHSHLKTVGICFGHQVLALAFGGQVEKNPLGWEIGIRENELAEPKHKYLQFENKIMKLHQMHQDHVTVAPPGFTVLASNNISPIHAMISSDSRCISVQGHPEFRRDISEGLINERMQKGLFSSEFAEEGLRTLDKQDDGILLGENILRFISERHSLIMN
ncbi:uncharacterized protein VTP21DRAFT_8066 [Calcarisporiella thermophila]|uniref:uncharacterized protein n=1 Tax=Calcarisporiella thermophila TaxID=911321 RepID=UPI0037441943